MFGFKKSGETTLEMSNTPSFVVNILPPDSYVTSLAETLCGHKGRRVLKPGAVPTILKHSENTPKRKPRLSRERRSHTRTRNEVNYIC